MIVEFSNAGFQERLGRLIGQAKNPVVVLTTAGRVVNEQLKAHFLRKDRSEANKLSERRSHFWDQVARSVNTPKLEGANTVTVTISDPRFVQKVYGGTITAKNADALTVPVEERAYGRMAGKGKNGVGSFEAETGLKLFLVKIGGSKSNSFEKAVLAVKDSQDSKAFTVEYILTPSVTQQADPDALPPQSALEEAILTQGQKAWDEKLQE